MTRSVPTPDEILELAVEALAVHYPDADSAFVAGSFMRGQGTATSDIDLVVLHPSLAQAYRESFIFQNIPVETFVHDPETLSWFLEQDRKDGRPALIGMLIEGVLIGPRQDTGRDFKKRASQMFAEGPPPLNTDAIERLRYAITDKLDDLETERTPAERIAIGAALYPLLVELALRGSSQWNGSGKWHARLLSQMDVSLARRVETAFLSLYDGSDTSGTATGRKLVRAAWRQAFLRLPQRRSRRLAFSLHPFRIVAAGTVRKPLQAASLRLPLPPSLLQTRCRGCNRPLSARWPLHGR